MISNRPPFLTPDEVAKQLMCPPSIVNGLIREGLLKTVPLLAALHGKQDVRCELTRDPRIQPGEPGPWGICSGMFCVLDAYPDEWVVPVYYPDRPNNTATPEAALEFAYAELAERGDLDPVIPLAELEAYLALHGWDVSAWKTAPGNAANLPPPPSKRRGPKPGPRDETSAIVIAALALRAEYRIEGKQGNGFIAKILRHVEELPGHRKIDEGTLRETIRGAFEWLENDF